MSEQWQPRVETRSDRVTESAAGALNDLLDTDTPAPHDGDALPILWHWLAFLPQARQSELGPDGHPKTGVFLPPAEERARMYAGGRVTLSGAVTIGEPLAKTAQVTAIQHKQGRTGELLLVTVGSDIAAKLGSLRETTDIVYRAKTPLAAPRPGADLIDGDWEWGRELRIDPTILFRFSALTYNAHRIHYDRQYAIGQEGYPGLVVHGPLQAIALTDLIRRAFPGRRTSEFSFRSTAPAFDTCNIELRLRGAEDTVELAVFSDGRRTMTATALLGPQEKTG
jgi:3-methylfumaryl-CoA hydratase